MNYKNIGIFVIALVIGWAGGSFFEKSTAVKEENQEIARMQSRIDHAKQFFPPMPSEMESISGTIKSISGTVVTVDAALPNPFSDLPALRMVHITENTVITKLVLKNQAAFQQEFAEFQRLFVTDPQSATAGTIISPSPFSRMSATIADLKEGRSVTVIAGNNIASEESFYAKAIEVTVINP